MAENEPTGKDTGEIEEDVRQSEGNEPFQGEPSGQEPFQGSPGTDPRAEAGQ